MQIDLGGQNVVAVREPLPSFYRSRKRLERWTLSTVKMEDGTDKMLPDKPLGPTITLIRHAGQWTVYPPEPRGQMFEAARLLAQVR